MRKLKKNWSTKPRLNPIPIPMIKHTLLLSLAFMLGAWESPTLAAQDKPITLAGQWRFQLDRADAGVRDGWFTRPLTGRITLPGGLTEQGIGCLLYTSPSPRD